MMIEMLHAGEFEGEAVKRFRLSNDNGMTADILTWGAVLSGLAATMRDGSRRNLVLGLKDFADYPSRSPYFGATIGRFGNRIGGASFELAGQTFMLDANETGVHHLHGGAAGLGRRVWKAEAAQTALGPALCLRIVSADGDMGYPGELHAQCTYTLTNNNCLIIEMEAETDRPCPVNLVHHSYWNLDGHGTIDRHRLRLRASRYLPTGPGQIPTGEISSVEGTELDFRQLRPLDHAGPPQIDFAFVLDGEDAGTRIAAELVSSDGECRMILATNQPAVQCYSGFKLDLQTSGGKAIGPRSGLCLETEAFPDAPNKPNFPCSVLHPGEVYKHWMSHQFEHQ